MMCLRPLVLEQDKTSLKPKKISLGLGLAGLVLCCETRSCHARRQNDLEGTATFQVLFIVTVFCAWNITIVENNSGIHLLKDSASGRSVIYR